MSIRLVWRTLDASGTAMRLASVVGGRVDHRGPGTAGGDLELVVPLVGGEIAVLVSDGPDRLAVGGLDEAAGMEPAAELRGAPVLLGIGWATVDADRALPEVAAALGLEVGAFRPATADDTLGAAVHIARTGPLAVVVLEPVTEGRTAAALARIGEGPCAIYVATASAAATEPGPLGPAILVMADRRSGPFVVAVRRRIAAPR